MAPRGALLIWRCLSGTGEAMAALRVAVLAVLAVLAMLPLWRAVGWLTPLGPL